MTVLEFLDEATEKRLVLQAKQGDKAAFDRLVQKYQPRVLSLICTKVSDLSEAKDLTQDVFIKVYCGLSKFRGDSAFYTWVYRVAINTVKNYHIFQKRRPPAHDVDVDWLEQVTGRSILQDTGSPERIALSNEMQEYLLDIVEDMSEDARIAFVLREMEGLSYEDIADIMECPLGTVRSRIFRARETIDRELAQRLQR